ncbi:hypothetical protein JTB14_034304 [Gonioctena quinquepunctata]|nr:hypothetical protein JTB14_034304 [Gonioctena quinquepunctata]
MLCPGYELHSRFRLKGGVCLYAKANLSCQREESLEPKDFDVMWFKLSDTKLTKFLCCLYLSPNEPSYNDLFEFLSLKLDYIQENHPTAETIIMGDFMYITLPGSNSLTKQMMQVVKPRPSPSLMA